MTVEQLRQYQRNKWALKVLRNEIEAWKTDPIVFPGIDGSRLIRPLQEQCMRIQLELAAVEKYINAVPEPDIRRMMELHILHGRTWESVCYELYGYMDRAYCHKAVKRYVARQEKERG